MIDHSHTTDLPNPTHLPLNEKHRRDATAPDGQILPDWMTWAEYTTTTEGIEVRTWSIVQLPQTYYGPSIPLGPDWTYGGASSPTAEATVLETEVTAVSVTDDGTLSEPKSRGDRPSRTRTRTNTRTNTPESERPTQSQSGSSSPTGALSSSGTLETSTAATLSSSPKSQSYLSSPSTLVSSTSQSSPTSSTSTFPDATLAASHNDLVPLLPSLLVPLVALLLLTLLLFWIWRRRRPSSTPTSVARPTGSGWLPASLRSAQSGHAYVAAGVEPEVGDTQPPPLPEKKPNRPEFTAPPPPATPTPTERSALLSEFKPQHHRQSSLPLARATGPPEEMDDELADLVSQNQTLLQRLAAGLVAISRSGSLRSGSSTRKPSGNVVERRGSGRYTLLDEGKGTSGAGARVKKPRSTRESGSQSAGTGNGSGSGHGDTSGSGAHGATMSDSQLFFRVPASSLSSNEANTSRGSNNSRGTSSGSGSTRNLRSSWYTSRYAQELPPGAQAPQWLPDPSSSPETPLPYSNQQPARTHEAIPEDVSIGVPSTEHSGDGDLGEFGRNVQSGDAMRFPSPPARAPITPPRTAQALDRRGKGYSHAPLSPFGSLPSTPAGSAESPRKAGPHSSSDHSKPAESSENQQGHLAYRPGSSLSAARPSSTVLVERSLDDPPELSPMANVFVATPPVSAGSGDRHRSYIGEPLVDMQRLVFDSDRRGVDEFGQSTLRRPVEVPSLVLPHMETEHQSETGSFYSFKSVASENVHARQSRGESAGYSQRAKSG